MNPDTKQDYPHTDSDINTDTKQTAELNFHL